MTCKANIYGWLAPNGDFFPVEWGEHQSWAHHKVRELGYITDDNTTWVDKNGVPRDIWIGEEGDILADCGWALLHSPGQGAAHVTHDDAKPLTKAQGEFLYAYYTDLGLRQEAEKYIS